MRLKVFRLTLNGVGVPTAVRDLLGLRVSRNQAQVLVVAPSKAAAFGLASAMYGLGVPARSDPDFRQATGNDVEALEAAGQLTEPRVLAYDGDSYPAAVAEIRADRQHRVIGQLARVEGFRFQFEPKGPGGTS